MKTFSTTAILFFLCFFSLFSYAAEYQGGDVYNITTPDNWVEIPKDVLDDFQKKVLTLTGVKESFDYGYQTIEAENWLEYPYVIVQVKRTGRVPEGELKKYKKLEKDLKKGVQTAEESTKGLVSEIVQGEMLYEPSQHILWTTVSMNVAEVGTIKAITAVKLTEYGVVVVLAYAKEKDFPTYLPIFQEMARNLKINPKDQYKPRFTDHAPTIAGVNLGSTFISSITGAIVGLIVALVFGLYKLFSRRNKES